MAGGGFYRRLLAFKRRRLQLTDARPPRTPRQRLCAAIAAVLGAFALACAAFWGLSAKTALDVQPYAVEAGKGAPSPWLDIDWDALLARNPDAVAWVHVPGTPVSYPVVQAREEEPERWLHRDLDGNWSAYGTVYMDSGCSVEGPVALVFGHHMIDGSMLSTFASYTSEDFREEHPRVYVQTPEGVGYVLKVQAAEVVSGTSSVPASFEWPSDESAWLEGKTGDGAVPACEWVFCTCSYTGVFPGNERTLAYARPKRVALLDGSEELASAEASVLSAEEAEDAVKWPSEAFSESKER